MQLELKSALKPAMCSLAAAIQPRVLVHAHGSGNYGESGSSAFYTIDTPPPPPLELPPPPPPALLLLLLRPPKMDSFRAFFSFVRGVSAPLPSPPSPKLPVDEEPFRSPPPPPPPPPPSWKLALDGKGSPSTAAGTETDDDV